MIHCLFINYRLNKKKKDEHMLHNPVYCDTILKEPSTREHGESVTNPHKLGQYSLAGPGMPSEFPYIDHEESRNQ